MAIKLNLDSLLALPTTLFLWFCLDCCLDGRSGSWSFGNNSAILSERSLTKYCHGQNRL